MRVQVAEFRHRPRDGDTELPAPGSSRPPSPRSQPRCPVRPCRPVCLVKFPDTESHGMCRLPRSDRTLRRTGRALLVPPGRLPSGRPAWTALCWRIRAAPVRAVHGESCNEPSRVRLCVSRAQGWPSWVRRVSLPPTLPHGSVAKPPPWARLDPLAPPPFSQRHWKPCRRHSVVVTCISVLGPLPVDMC